MEMSDLLLPLLIFVTLFFSTSTVIFNSLDEKLTQRNQVSTTQRE